MALEHAFRNLLAHFQEEEFTREDIIGDCRAKITGENNKSALKSHVDALSQLLHKQSEHDRAIDIIHAMFGYFTEEGMTHEQEELLGKLGFKIR
jgi:uncharacterized protein YbgA (DUF1722 family)